MKKQLIWSALLATSLFACNAPQTNKKDDASATGSFTITEATYGVIGTDTVKAYTLTNPKGMKATILNYGGTVTQLYVPDKAGTLGDVILGFDSLSGYLQKNNPYFGCLVGRYANRINAGKFVLDGKTYQLALNDHGNTLHGGIKGFDKVIWSAQKLAGDSSLQLTYISKDGEEGYPGTLTVQVVYSLTANNELQIAYKATTDKTTPVNLTNHCYFNLSAGTDSTILNHSLTLNANAFTAVNDKLIPTGSIDAVKGSAMDFTSEKIIGKDIASVKGGFDHNWVLTKNNDSLTQAATLYHAASGRKMEVFTTEPGIQFYSGNFLDGTLIGKNKQKYVQHAALCLETQHFPDGPNQPKFPNTILKPGDTYHQLTIYKFSNQ